MTEASERMSDEAKQVRLDLALDRVRSAFPALNEFHGYAHGVAMTDIRIIVEAYDRLRSELSTRPLPAVEDEEVGPLSVSRVVKDLGIIAGGIADTRAPFLLSVGDLLTRLSTSLRAAEGERDRYEAAMDDAIAHAVFSKSALSLAQAERDRAREALEKIAREDHAGTHYRDLAQHTLRALKPLTAPADGKEPK